MIITTHAIRRYRERVDPDATFDRLRFELSRSLKVPSRHAERIARDPRRRINHRRCHHRVSTRAVFVCIGTKCVTVLRLSWESFVDLLVHVLLGVWVDG